MALLDVNNKHCFLPGSPISDDIILTAKRLLMPGEMAMMSPELAILYDRKTPPVGQVPDRSRPQQARLCPRRLAARSYEFIVLSVRHHREPTPGPSERLSKATAQMPRDRNACSMSQLRVTECVSTVGLTLRIFRTFLKAQVHPL